MHTYTYTISKVLQFESIHKIYIYIYLFLFSLQKGDEPCMCISHSYEAIRN